MRHNYLLQGITSVLYILLCLFCDLAQGGSVSLTSSNFDTLVAQNELVFLNFYADWCRFSQTLAPIFNEAAETIQKEFPEPGKILFGKVDCESETNIAARFRITKYPTLKLIRLGKVMKREYRGQRSLSAIIDYVRNLLKNPLVELQEGTEVEKVEDNKRGIIGYLSSSESPVYAVFKKVAMDLRDDCQFYVTYGSSAVQPGTEKLIFKPAKSKVGEADDAYIGVLQSYDEMKNWATERCIPLVREITFENAEELTEEGLPFLILFHHPDDKESIQIFNREVETQILDERSNINFLIADGVKFSHPLHHLGKDQKDLPLIAIDSFRHMYLFPKFEDIKEQGKLKRFIQDLHSGKLHREFHYGPDPTTDEIQQIQTDPPESSFRKLAPSRNRYTLLRDEL